MEKLKILIPTNFTVQAEYAYLMVRNLQSRLPSEIHFLHVLDVPDTVTQDAAGNVQTCGEIDVSYVVNQKKIAERNLAGLVASYGADVHTHLIFGRPTNGILNFSVDNDFDLIVMGTSGAWGIKEKLSGSETQMIARRSGIPVLSLMCDRSELQINNILLVHDFTHPANENLTMLHKFINAFGAKVHFLQITSGKQDEEMPAVRKNMDAFAAMNGIGQYDCHLVHDKDVEAGVVHFNQMNNMDIICIGTHGKGGWFHQSAAEQIIKHMFKPIISFHLKNK